MQIFIKKSTRISRISRMEYGLRQIGNNLPEKHLGKMHTDGQMQI